MVDSQEFEALWPGGVSAIDVVAPAPRGDLKGKRIGFLWDDMFRGEGGRAFPKGSMTSTS